MENKKTCLYDKHVELNALMSPFGGFIMPIQYSSITEEHNAVRQPSAVASNRQFCPSHERAVEHCKRR